MDNPNAPTPPDAVHPHVARAAVAAHKAIDLFVSGKTTHEQFTRVMNNLRWTKQSIDRKENHYELIEEIRK